MDYVKMFVERWKRWWAWIKISLPKRSLEPKMSVSKFYKPFREYWPFKLYEGTKNPPMFSDPDDYPHYPEITLSAFAETGQVESNIPVLEQRSYTGKSPAISSALANTLCADLGIDGVLNRLNASLGTSYTLESRILRLLGIIQLHSILEPYIVRNDDFGTVYAHLRPYWYHYNITAIRHELCTQKEKDREMRQNVLVHDRITRRDVPPRRVWDLYANRVVPYWVVNERPWAISHAWVDEKDRVDVMTPINGYEWPVPMPKDASLDLIRIEMLNLGARYGWLDVLCLRQDGGKYEYLRKEEWKLDVPTIGAVYDRDADVLCYFNGLGRPLDLMLGDFESDRSWFRRAWTLQEITRNPIIGGETRIGIMEEKIQKRFDEQLTSLREVRRKNLTLEIVSEMQNRVSTKPLDKVAGLVYILQTESIPIYDAEKSEEDAWEVLVDVMWSALRADLFFYYPEPGNRRKCWRPSWEQVMTNKITVPYRWPGLVHQIGDADMYEGHCIESGNVQNLAVVPKKGELRQGELIFKDAIGSLHKIKIVADHAYPIPDGLYTLIGCDDDGDLPVDIWVVGQRNKDGKFEKMSVFRSADDAQVRLQQLRLKRRETLLC